MGSDNRLPHISSSTQTLNVPGRNEQENQLSASLSTSTCLRRFSSDSGFKSTSALPHSLSTIPPLPQIRSTSTTPSVFFSQSQLVTPEPPQSSHSSIDIPIADGDVWSRRFISRGSSSGSNNQRTIPVIQVDSASPEASEETQEQQEEEEPQLDEEGIVNIIPPKSWCKRILYVLFFPLIVLLYFTLPNVRKPVGLIINCLTNSCWFSFPFHEMYTVHNSSVPYTMCTVYISWNRSDNDMDV